MKGQPTEFEPVPMDSEDDLFIVYTSGTTNNPKQIVHSQAGFLLYAAFTRKVHTFSSAYDKHFPLSNYNLSSAMCEYLEQLEHMQYNVVIFTCCINEQLLNFSCSSSLTCSQETSLAV